MPATALKLAAEEPLVDINHASARELESALPGIGEVLARRIVAYREVHGPFEDPNDLLQVPGISERRASKAAPRISLAPVPSGFRIAPAYPVSESRAAAPSIAAPPSNSEQSPAEERRPLNVIAPARPSVASEAAASEELFGSMGPSMLREPIAPSLDSLLPAEFQESLREEVQEREPEEAIEPGIVLGATTRPEPNKVTEVVVDEEFVLPMRRPLRLALALAAIGVFSALVGSVFGLRSQSGHGIDRRVDRVQTEVVEVEGTVKGLERQAGTLATSIDTLDKRISAQEQKAAPPRAAAAVDPRSDAVGQSVRRALQELEARRAQREGEPAAVPPH